jgi:integrase
LDIELSLIGIPGKWPRWKKEKQPEGYVNEQKRRNITFHSLRHTYITLSRLAGIIDVEIQALAGHKDGRMMNNYTHTGQVLDFTVAREKLERAINSA